MLLGCRGNRADDRPIEERGAGGAEAAGDEVVMSVSEWKKKKKKKETEHTINQ